MNSQFSTTLAVYMWSRLGRAAVTSKAGLKVAGKAVAVASASAVAFGAKVALCEEGM